MSRRKTNPDVLTRTSNAQAPARLSHFCRPVQIPSPLCGVYIGSKEESKNIWAVLTRNRSFKSRYTTLLTDRRHSQMLKKDPPKWYTISVRLWLRLQRCAIMTVLCEGRIILRFILRTRLGLCWDWVTVPCGFYRGHRHLFYSLKYSGPYMECCKIAHCVVCVPLQHGGLEWSRLESSVSARRVHSFDTLWGEIAVPLSWLFFRNMISGIESLFVTVVILPTADAFRWYSFYSY